MSPGQVGYTINKPNHEHQRLKFFRDPPDVHQFTFIYIAYIVPPPPLTHLSHSNSYRQCYPHTVFHLDKLHTPNKGMFLSVFTLEVKVQACTAMYTPDHITIPFSGFPTGTLHNPQPYHRL